jgi:hypothetical protein
LLCWLCMVYSANAGTCRDVTEHVCLPLLDCYIQATN